MKINYPKYSLPLFFLVSVHIIMCTKHNSLAETEGTDTNDIAGTMAAQPSTMPDASSTTNANAYYSLFILKNEESDAISIGLSIITYESESTCEAHWNDTLPNANNHAILLNGTEPGEYRIIPADDFSNISITDEKLASIRYFEPEKRIDNIDLGKRPVSGFVRLTGELPVQYEQWPRIKDNQLTIQIEMDQEKAQNYIYSTECNVTYGVDGGILDPLTCACVEERGNEFSCEAKDNSDNCCMKGEHLTQASKSVYEVFPCGYLCASNSSLNFEIYCSPVVEYENDGDWMSIPDTAISSVSDTETDSASSSDELESDTDSTPQNGTEYDTLTSSNIEFETDSDECRSCEMGDWENLYILIAGASSDSPIPLEDYTLSIQSHLDNTWNDFGSTACSETLRSVHLSDYQVNCSSTFLESNWNFHFVYKDGREISFTSEIPVIQGCRGKYMTLLEIRVPEDPSQAIIVKDPVYLNSCELYNRTDS